MPSAVFIGDTSLLVRCAELALAEGFTVAAVGAADRKVRAWAQANAIFAFDPSTEVYAPLSSIDFEYLFSVGNLDVVPEDVLKRARKLAANFHDGPLPTYAGLNTPIWALLRAEARHSVTWHEMVASVDAGPILETRSFAIDADETALSLNAKCYEAGFACFEQLIEHILAGKLHRQMQGGPRRYYKKSRRAPLAASIDFASTAEAIAKAVRATQVGPYGNPLGVAKLRLPDGLLFVADASVLPPKDQTLPPGRVIEVDAHGVSIATAGAPIRLSGLTTIDGSQAPPNALRSLAPGSDLPLLDQAAAARLEELNAAAALEDQHWLSILSRAEAIEFPFPGADARSEDGFHRFSLRGCDNTDCDLGAIFAWLSNVAGAERLTAYWRSASQSAQLHEMAPWFDPWRPVALTLRSEDDAPAICRSVSVARAAFAAAGPMACDVRSRLTQAERSSLQPICLAVYFGDDVFMIDVPRSAAIVVAVTSTSDLHLLLRKSVFGRDTSEAIAEQIHTSLQNFASGDDVQLADMIFSSETERALFSDFSTGTHKPAAFRSIAEALEIQTALTPERTALESRLRSLTFKELDQQVSAIARQLALSGVGPGSMVGVCLDRRPELVTAILGVLRAGAAYIPLDPAHPSERVAFIAKDAELKTIITNREIFQTQSLDPDCALFVETLFEKDSAGDVWIPPYVAPEALAYVMYTSGSTGRPKGVMVSHSSLANFFAAMDEVVVHDSASKLLAVTGAAFDISVLELLWTLTRGLTVALHSPALPGTQLTPPGFSLFYFASAPSSPNGYRLLLEGAKFADANGFEAIWTPERHFHAFGSPYPNPAVVGAALATATSRIAIRAGSCVLPLHHPLRVAEEWAVVDVLSNGRVGLSLASGWQPNDFVLNPTEFKDRKQSMLARAAEVQRLWRGEAVAYVNPNGALVETRTFPRPVQPELPIWLTAARSPETFEAAGERGYNVLTHLLGMAAAEVEENIKRYRNARRDAGHAGRGRVTLMLHTFVGEDDVSVRETVREPMKRYLADAVDLVRDASWTFPTVVDRARAKGTSPAEMLQAEPLTGEELDAVLEYAFDRYFTTSGLFGDRETCLATISRLASMGVDEIACLIDFGVDEELVLGHLRHLKHVKDHARADGAGHERVSIVDDLIEFRPTHLQCTPSTMRMILDDRKAKDALSSLRIAMLGGEALSPSLARELRSALPAECRLLNMYGPTETTVWSTTCELSAESVFTPLGRPILNTTLDIVGANGCVRSALAAGELLIGGPGVAAGYWRRPDETTKRFVKRRGQLMYRTGDLVRRHRNGALEFLGRFDTQIKLRGHRVDLAEIEVTLRRHEGIAEVVVVARDDHHENRRLVAYYSKQRDKSVDENSLRNAAALWLPEIMRPGVYVELDALPLNANQKIDRQALPDPAATRTAPSAQPRQGMEATVATVWRDLLGLPQIGTDDNFFELGGHSLLAAQMQRRLKEATGCDLRLTDVFRFPTVRGLADHLSGKAAAAPPTSSGKARAQARLGARPYTETSA